MTIRTPGHGQHAGSINAKSFVPLARLLARPPNADGICEKLKMLLEQSVCWGGRDATAEEVFDELEGTDWLSEAEAGKSLPSFGKAAAFDAKPTRPWLRHGLTEGD